MEASGQKLDRGVILNIIWRGILNNKWRSLSGAPPIMPVHEIAASDQVPRREWPDNQGAPIPKLPLACHLREHWLILIDVIVDDYVALWRVQSVQSARHIGRAVPRQDIGMVRNSVSSRASSKPSAKITPRRDKHTLLAIRDCLQGFCLPRVSVLHSSRLGERPHSFREL